MTDHDGYGQFEIIAEFGCVLFEVQFSWISCTGFKIPGTFTKVAFSADEYLLPSYILEKKSQVKQLNLFIFVHTVLR